MLKLTKTGIGLLTKQYRSVLRKCFFLNLVFFSTVASLTGLLLTNSYSENINVASSSTWYSSPNGLSLIEAHSGTSLALLYSNAVGSYSYIDENGVRVGAPTLDFYYKGAAVTRLASDYFRLNNSGYATGIDFAANVTAGTTDASHLATTGAVNQLLNYYYTFRVGERDEVIDSASFFQKDFSTLQEVDLQSKNPTHLGAFAKCDEVCPRPSERFASSLSQEQMFKNDASVDAGTSRHCLRQFGDVVADLLKNTAAKSLRISEFTNEEVCHA